MEENKINALMDMTVSKIRQLVDADTIIGKPISTPDGITVIPVSRMSFGIGTGGTTGSKGFPLPAATARASRSSRSASLSSRTAPAA